MWYNGHDMLTKNKLFNFLISMRGDGKTFFFKDWSIRDFLKTGHQFIYLRRYKTELMDIGKFWNDIKDKYPGHSFDVKGKNLMIDNKIAGYAVALSNSLTKKSVAYPLVNKIGFDEFIIEKSNIQYLQKEVTTFLEYFETVARLRDDVRAIFMANAISIVNPYFVYFNIFPEPNKRFTCRGEICIDMFTDDEFKEKKYQTRFGQLIKGTNYGDYAIENKFKNDTIYFIEKRSPDSKFQGAISFQGHIIGIWYDFKEGTAYCSKKYDKNSPFVFAFTKDDYKPNYSLLKNYKDHWMTDSVVNLFKDSNLYFEDSNIKNLMYTLFSKMNIFR